MTVGMIHGRFQPFHVGHRQYLLQAAAQCDQLVVGITNPDPRHAVLEPEDPTRHLPQSNPFSYLDRVRMVGATCREIGMPSERVDIVPFPIHEPEVWCHYTTMGTVQFIRLYSDWGAAKVARLRAYGFDVVILDEGASKTISGTDVRSALEQGASWDHLVPPAVSEVIRMSEAYTKLAHRDRTAAPLCEGREEPTYDETARGS